MQAIKTKYLGPTDKKGSRIKATCEYKSITIPYDHALSGIAVHAKAAIELARKMKWEGELISGGIESGSYVFCFTNSDKFKIN